VATWVSSPTQRWRRRPRLLVRFTPAASGATPDAPVIGTATAGVLSLSIAWTEGDDQGTTILNHDLRYRVGGGAATTVESIGLTSPYVLTGLVAGTSVDVAIRTVAQDGVDEVLSDWSAYSNAVVILAPVPSSATIDSGPSRVRGAVRLRGTTRPIGETRRRGSTRAAAR
jgi:hypothetical protein